MSEME
jgi:hypothetical protein